MGNICSDFLLLQAFTKRLNRRCEREEQKKKKKEQQMQNLAALVRVHADPGVFLCSG